MTRHATIPSRGDRRVWVWAPAVAVLAACDGGNPRPTPGAQEVAAPVRTREEQAAAPAGPRPAPRPAPSASQAGAASVGYRQLYKHFFVPSCSAQTCHSGAEGMGGMSFDDLEASYKLIVDAEPYNAAAAEEGYRRVKPGDVNKSLLWTLLTKPQDELTQRNFGWQMPMGGMNAPGPLTMAALRQWIEAGAPMEGKDAEFDFEDRLSGTVICGAQDAAGLRACLKPPMSAKKFKRVYSLPLQLLPRRNIHYCTYLPGVTDKQILIQSLRGQQMVGGHHLALNYVHNPREPGLAICDDGMSELIFTGAAGPAGQDTYMPRGVAMVIPAGVQLVLRSHYINYSDNLEMVMDALDIEYANPSAKLKLAYPFLFQKSDFVIPARAKGHTVEARCRFDKPLEIFMMIGHTHERATQFAVEWVESGSDSGKLLYHATSGWILRNSPQVKKWLPEPLRMKQGDELRMHCMWNNDTDSELKSPDEMCLTVMYYAPGSAWLRCKEGEDTPRAITP